MKAKLPQDITMQELGDLMFVAIKANFPNIKDEGVELILEYFDSGLEVVEDCDDFWEDNL